MSKTLKQAIAEICVNTSAEIPWIVKLLENPSSPVALPGKIFLYNHDCLHVLLDRGLSLQDEAYIVGFTMGNDPAIKTVHVWLFKFFSRFIYPKKYQFRQQDFLYFDRGFQYGVELRKFGQFNRIDFKQYENWKVRALREKLGIGSRNLCPTRN